MSLAIFVSVKNKASRTALSILLIILSLSTCIFIANINEHIAGTLDQNEFINIIDKSLFTRTNSSTSLTKAHLATKISYSEKNVILPRGNFAALLQRHKTYRIYVDGEPGGALRAWKRSVQYDLVLSMEIPRIKRPMNVFCFPLERHKKYNIFSGTKRSMTRSSKRSIDVLYTSSHCNTPTSNPREEFVGMLRAAVEKEGLRFEYNGRCRAGSMKKRYKNLKTGGNEPALDSKMIIAMPRSQDPDTEALDEKLGHPMNYGAIPIYKGNGARLAKEHGFPETFLDRANYSYDEDFARAIIDLALDPVRIDAMQTKMLDHNWGEITENYCRKAHEYIELHPPDWLKNIHSGILTLSKKNGVALDQNHEMFQMVQCIFGTVQGVNYSVILDNTGQADIEIEQCCWAR